MTSRLILNADDFGLTPGINTAIAELHDAGALTSATLMASGPAFAHAVAIARQRPSLGVGCHILLTDGVPISPPRTIPTLVTRGGTLRPKLTHFLAALLTGQIDPSDIEREATAQIRTLQRAGLQITHVDTHKHTHILPGVLAPVLRAALSTGVRAIRNPFEQPWAFPLSNGTAARTSQIRLLQPLKHHFRNQPAIRAGQVRTTDGTVGISATGNLDEPTLRNLLQALPEGTWELVSHPGYNDAELDRITTRLRATREIERQALLAVLSPRAGQQPSDGTNPRERVSTSIEVTEADLRFSQPDPHPSHLKLIHYGDLNV
jgi:chitin disaccharide deacetylase